MDGLSDLTLIEVEKRFFFGRNMWDRAIRELELHKMGRPIKLGRNQIT